MRKKKRKRLYFTPKMGFMKLKYVSSILLSLKLVLWFLAHFKNAYMLHHHCHGQAMVCILRVFFRKSHRKSALYILCYVPKLPLNPTVALLNHKLHNCCGICVTSWWYLLSEMTPMYVTYLISQDLGTNLRIYKQAWYWPRLLRISD